MQNKLFRQIASVLLAVVFIIPAVGLSISRHQCVDCHETQLSLVFHHHDNCPKSCTHHEADKNWHFHFSEKHKNHDKNCQYEQIKLKIPFIEPELNSEFFPVDYLGFINLAKPILLLYGSEIIKYPVNYYKNTR